MSYLNQSLALFNFESTKIFSIYSVTMTQRSHPFPFRTRKLSSAVLMILGGKLPGKVGRRRNKKRTSRLTCSFSVHYLGLCFGSAKSMLVDIVFYFFVFICDLNMIFIYWDKERSSFSARIRNFSKISLSIVMLIFSFNGFKIYHLVR